MTTERNKILDECVAFIESELKDMRPNDQELMSPGVHAAIEMLGEMRDPEPLRGTVRKEHLSSLLQDAIKASVSCDPSAASKWEFYHDALIKFMEQGK